MRELKALTGDKVPKMGMDDKVYGSAVLGPKIGQGFYQNLTGNFHPITMDLWFMRSWGRITNTGVGQPDLPPIFDRFTDALKPKTGAGAEDEEGADRRGAEIFDKHEDDYVENREAYSRVSVKKTNWFTPANGWSMSHDGKWSRCHVVLSIGAGSTMCSTRACQTERRMASLSSRSSAQATWWTPEKYLYAKMGAKCARGRDRLRQEPAQARGDQGSASMKLGLRSVRPRPHPPDNMSDEDIARMAKLWGKISRARTRKRSCAPRPSLDACSAGQPTGTRMSILVTSSGASSHQAVEAAMAKKAKKARR